MPKGKARYGVVAEGNPFAPGGSIDPSSNPNADKVRLPVDGFRRLTEIRQKMQTAREQEVPLFVLVSGPQGAGRRSMEYAVLDLWRQIAKIENDRFARVRAKAKNDSDLDLLRAWLSQFVLSLANLKGLDFDEKNMSNLASAVSLTNIDEMKLRLKLALGGPLSTAFKKANMDIGASFYEIRQPMVDEICSVFEGLPKVCVLSFSHKEKPDQNLQIDADCQLVHAELGPLSDVDLADIVKARWGGATAVPFDVEAVQKFFAGQKPHLGEALETLRKLFEMMAASHANEGGVWPDDQTLYFGPDQVRATLNQIAVGI